MTIDEYHNKINDYEVQIVALRNKKKMTSVKNLFRK